MFFILFDTNFLTKYIHRGMHVCENLDVFHGFILIYPTYENNIYALVHPMNKWKNYLMGKEILIHTDHQPLWYM